MKFTKLIISVLTVAISLSIDAQEPLNPYETYDTNSTIKLIGFYTNEKSSDGEHSSGYFLHLWSLSGQLVGKLTYNEGLIGSGKAEWIKGQVTEDSIKFESTIYDYKVIFNGLISDRKVSGNFEWSNVSTDKNQELKKCCEDALIHRNFQNLKAFMEKWAESDKY